MATRYTYQELYTAALRMLALNLETLGEGEETEVLEQAKQWPNQALDDLVRYHRWPWLYLSADLPLAEGAATVTLPSDFDAMAPDTVPVLVSEQGRCLRPADRAALQLEATYAGSQLPERFAIDYAGSSYRLVLGRPADRGYTIRLAYLRTIPAMVADGDYAAIPPAMHDILRLGTLAIAEEDYNGVPAGRYRPAYEAAKQAARTRGNLNPNDVRPPRAWSRPAMEAEIAPDVTITE